MKSHSLKKWIILFICSFASSIKAQNLGKYNQENQQILDSISRLIYINSLSNNGKWIAYTEIFNLNDPITYFQSTQNSVRNKLGTIKDLKFSPNSNWLVYALNNNSTILKYLSTNKKLQYENIKIFAFSPSGNYLSLLSFNGEVTLVNLRKMTIEKFRNVSDYKWNPKEDCLALIISKKKRTDVVLINLETKTTELSSSSNSALYHNMLWSENGKKLFWTENHNESYSISSYDINGTKKILNNGQLNLQIPESEISDNRFYVSKDGNQLFFKRIISKIEAKNKENYQLWKTKDAWVKPKYDNFIKHYLSDFQTIWRIESDEIVEITDFNFPVAQYNANHSYALVSNPLQYEPQFKEAQYVDLYLKCLKTGQISLILKNQYNKKGFV